MSTSTMSKAEEHGRMADVEATFEDRRGRDKKCVLKKHAHSCKKVVA